MSKVVAVTYCVEDVFRIPKDLDLEDKTQVVSWGVKWNVLHITKVDGTELKIQSDSWINNYDYKNPDDIKIEDASTYGIEDESEDEEEEE